MSLYRASNSVMPGVRDQGTEADMSLWVKEAKDGHSVSLVSGNFLFRQGDEQQGIQEGRGDCGQVTVAIVRATMIFMSLPPAVRPHLRVACGAAEDKGRSPAGRHGGSCAERQRGPCVLLWRHTHSGASTQTGQGIATHDLDTAVFVLVCNNRASRTLFLRQTETTLMNKSRNEMLSLGTFLRVPPPDLSQDPAGPPPTAEKPAESIFHVLVSQAVDNGVEEGSEDNKGDRNRRVPKHGVGG